jgi:hypothetical protein
MTVGRTFGILIFSSLVGQKMAIVHAGSASIWRISVRLSRASLKLDTTRPSLTPLRILRTTDLARNWCRSTPYVNL